MFLTGKHMSRRTALKVRVKTARRRTASSTRWLERQLNDPYVARARDDWKRFKGEGHAVSYWRQDESGRWLNLAAAAPSAES